MRPFKKDVTCLMTFFTQTPFAKLRQFHSITYPVLFIKNKKLWDERKEDFLHVWLFQCITLY